MADQRQAIIGTAVLSEADFVKAWPAVPSFNRMRRMALLWVFAFPLVLLGTVVSGGRADLPPWDVVKAVLPATFCVGVGIWFLVAVPKRWAKTAIKDLGTDRVTFRIDDEGVHFESTERKASVAWSAIPQAFDTPESWLVYTGTQALLLVPKRAFEAAELAQLKELLAARVAMPAARGSQLRRYAIILVVLVVALSFWHYAGMQGR